MKINQAELDAFKLTLPESIREEYFKWLITCYDIAKALFIIQRESLPKGEINVKVWAEATGLAGEPIDDDKVIRLFNGVEDRKAMLPHIDTTIPIIIVEHVWGKGKKKETSTLIIDGNHRLRKAFLTKQETIGAYYIKKDLSKYVICD